MTGHLELNRTAPEPHVFRAAESGPPKGARGADRASGATVHATFRGAVSSGRFEGPSQGAISRGPSRGLRARPSEGAIERRRFEGPSRGAVSRDRTLSRPYRTVSRDPLEWPSRVAFSRGRLEGRSRALERGLASDRAEAGQVSPPQLLSGRAPAEASLAVTCLAVTCEASWMAP